MASRNKVRVAVLGASGYSGIEAVRILSGHPFVELSVLTSEHYAGRDPSQGTELCAVVEAMFSLETDMAILGDAAFGDRLEKIAYNALPATLIHELQHMISFNQHVLLRNGQDQEGHRQHRGNGSCGRPFESAA